MTDLADLTALFGNIEDQNRGAELELRDPVTGAPTGMKIRIAGPDSKIQTHARQQAQDELADLLPEYRRRVGQTIKAKDRERISVEMLARCVLSWNLQQDGQDVPCTHETIVRVLTAAAWVREQVDEFAGSRTPYWKTPATTPKTKKGAK
ncbi:MAG: hypothetical protein AB7O44_29170 [Hyphomicrobiaceae bacterium]